jgi:hypothetical protein
MTTTTMETPVTPETPSSSDCRQRAMTAAPALLATALVAGAELR